jgi:hypothetical protein
MNKKISRILWLLLFVSMIISVTGTNVGIGKQPSFQPPVEWTKTYGSEKIDWGHCVQQTSDGGYIITGALGRNAFMPWRGDIYILKIDRDGEEQWSQTHGISYNENVGRSIQQTSDGGYIIAGYTGYTYHIDGYVVKTNGDGNISWTSEFGNFDYYDNLQDASQTSDGGYIAVGWTSSYGAGSADIWLIKMNSEGTEEWNHTFGSTGLDGGNHVQQTTDGGFIVTGMIELTGGNSNLLLLKTDANGNEEWTQTFGGSDYEEGSSVQQTTDGGYILTGLTYSAGAGEGDIWLIKTDSDGNVEWQYTFGGTAYDQAHSVQQTIDGGYFIAGEYTNPSTLTPDMYLIKTDENGLEEWSDIIDNEGKEDVANYGIQTMDCGYVVVGNTGVYQDELVDVLVMKYQGSNTPPYEPANPSPADTASNVSIECDLSWTGGDPDNDTVTYDLYFGTTPSPPLVTEDLTETSFNPGTLSYFTTYYWMIRATDSFGAFTDGPVWSFTTEKELPLIEIGAITGSKGLSAVIQNNGNADANNVTWEIYITGGIFKLIYKSYGGLLPIIAAGSQTTVNSKRFIGFGKIDITVSASCEEVPIPVEKKVSGRIFLLWITI